MIGQMHVHLTLADAGIELGSIPASEPTVNDPSPFRVLLDVYKLTVDKVSYRILSLGGETRAL